MLPCWFLCHVSKALFFIKIALKLSYFCKKCKISSAGGSAPRPPCLRRLATRLDALELICIVQVVETTQNRVFLPLAYKHNNCCFVIVSWMKREQGVPKTLYYLKVLQIMTLQHLLQVGVTVTDHVAMVAPVSVHVLIIPPAGIRSPLQEYSNVSPARNCVVRALAGMVTALAWGATGVSQTKSNNYKKRQKSDCLQYLLK